MSELLREISLYQLDINDLLSLVRDWDEPDYRALQIWQGLYQQFWESPDQLSTIPAALIQNLLHSYPLFSLVQVSSLTSLDGWTQKSLFKLSDNNLVETVLMGYRNRRTVCVSTQSGCAMGCVFCATGQMGLQRNLSSGEIVEQVIYFARQLNNIGERISNVVFMGMGEPFHNYDATMSAIERLNHPQGLNLGARRFTISTVGLVPAIHRFTSEQRQINLAISLHSVNDDVRSSLIPINKKYPVNPLMDACYEYVMTTGRRITFEWALINGLNDTEKDAHALAEKLQVFRKGRSILCHVNVIPLNPTHKYHGQSTSLQKVKKFQHVLENREIPCTIRLRRGIDIQAGCGQLAAQSHTSG